MENMTDQQWCDSVTLVDQYGKVLGAMDKYLAHQKPPVLHQAVSVWLFNQRGEILFQQRSAKKFVGAGEWGNTICGNVRFEEINLHCAYRRLYQELGLGEENNWDERVDKRGEQFQKEKIKKYQQKIGLNLKSLYKFTYQVECNNQYDESEIDEVFISELSDKLIKTIKPNFAEVAQVVWLDKRKLLKQTTLKLTPWTKIMLENKKLKNFFMI